jgi:hypothetical protein
MRDANAQGITEITLRRAKKAIGVRSFQESREWFCALDSPNKTLKELYNISPINGSALLTRRTRTLIRRQTLISPR